MDTAAYTLCLLRHNNESPGRYPTNCEILKGVPSHFRVSEVCRKAGNHVDKYYYSPSGKKYRSVAEVKRSYVQLNIYIDDVRQGVFPFLSSSYVLDVARGFGNNVLFTYNGNAYSCGRLEDIIESNNNDIYLKRLS